MTDCTFWKIIWLAAHSGKNHDSQHILRKKMISSTFWEKNCQLCFFSQNVLLIMFSHRIYCQLYIFSRMCCQSCFFPECAANHVFSAKCAEINMISSTFWEKKPDWQHILGKTWLAAHSRKKTWLTANYGGKTWLIAHSEKKYDWQHIMGKTMVHATNHVFPQNVLPTMFFFPECAANHVFFPECAVKYVFFPRMCS
jgi:hypothetical protein